MTLVRRVVVTGVVVATVVVIAMAAVLVVGRGRTPPIHDEAGRPVAGSIAELGWVTLGGARQAVLIRGADSTKPVILFLHGGPGMPAMYLAHAFQRPMERDFVMVQWDRRGAGRSYGAREPVDSLTVPRTIADLYELTSWLRARFHRPRIGLVAHSWGTLLGLPAVAEHPEWYRFYVGTGQLAPDTAAAHATQRRLVVEAARGVGEDEIVARLEDSEAQVGESDLFAVGGELHDATSFWPLLRTGLVAPEYTLSDVLNVQRGAQLLGTRFAGMPAPELPKKGDALSVPVFFFLGRYDYNTPSEIAADYLDSLMIPLGGVIWFEQSAHFPFFEEPERFHRELRRVDSLAEAYWASRPTP